MLCQVNLHVDHIEIWQGTGSVGALGGYPHPSRAQLSSVFRFWSAATRYWINTRDPSAFLSWKPNLLSSVRIDTWNVCPFCTQSTVFWFNKVLPAIRRERLLFQCVYSARGACAVTGAERTRGVERVAKSVGLIRWQWQAKSFYFAIKLDLLARLTAPYPQCCFFLFC